jgi:hypothetical protein
MRWLAVVDALMGWMLTARHALPTCKILAQSEGAQDAPPLFSTLSPCCHLGNKLCTPMKGYPLSSPMARRMPGSSTGWSSSSSSPLQGRPHSGSKIALARLLSAAVASREWAPSSKSKRRRHAGTAVVSARRLTGNGCAVQSVACQPIWAGQSWAELTRAVWTKREQR